MVIQNGGDDTGVQYTQYVLQKADHNVEPHRIGGNKGVGEIGEAKKNDTDPKCPIHI